MKLKALSLAREHGYAWMLVAGGAIGFLASLILTIDQQRTLENPAFVPACNINPVISCGSVMETAQASALGFPNSWIGIAGFTAVIVVGVSMLAGAKFKPWYWQAFTLGTLLGLIMVHWLFSESLYSLKTLCPWCLVVWAVTIPISWFTLIRGLRTGDLPAPASWNKTIVTAYNYKYLILLVWYLVIMAAILQRFWYYFETLL